MVSEKNADFFREELKIKIEEEYNQKFREFQPWEEKEKTICYEQEIIQELLEKNRVQDLGRIVL